MKVLVYGAGSIGLFLGAKLSSSGHDVVLIGKNKLSSVGDSVFVDGKKHILPERRYFDVGERFDIIFVTTKLYDTLNVLNEIKSKKLESDSLCIIQNGLLDIEYYGEHRRHKGFSIISIFQGYNLREGKILTSKSKIGWLISGSASGKEIAWVLSKAGINAQASEQADRYRAEKMIMNCSVNALSAIYNCPVGELISDSKKRVQVEDLYNESYKVLSKKYSIEPLAKIKSRFYKMIEQVGHHYSSMHQDLMSHRKTEIDFLNGYIISLGKKVKIKTPANEEVYRKLIDKIKEQRDKEVLTY